MEKSLELEKAANLYAGSRLKALRDGQTRAAFGERIGMKESLLYEYERGTVNIAISKMARVAKILGVPLSTFILPDDHLAFGDADGGNNDDKETETVA